MRCGWSRWSPGKPRPPARGRSRSPSEGRLVRSLVAFSRLVLAIARLGVGHGRGVGLAVFARPALFARLGGARQARLLLLSLEERRSLAGWHVNSSLVGRNECLLSTRAHHPRIAPSGHAFLHARGRTLPDAALSSHEQRSP